MCRKLFLSFVVIALASCSDTFQDDLTIKMAETKKMPTTDTHFVSYSDVAALTKAESTSTRASSNATAEIKCITGNKTNDTLLYVCQTQEGGWTVYSSDTRVPAIVAQSDGGSFDDLMKIEGAKLWIQSMADDMAAIRQLDDDKLNFTRGEIENNKAFWESITSPDEFVKKMLKESATRGGVFDSLAILEPIIPGHYEYSFTDSYTQVYDSIPRLTETDWYQGFPYNYYCPTTTDGSGLNAPAGCVAIAGAQMLYYLHDKLQVPQYAPSQAYCNGDINYYTWDQTDPSSTIWNSMNNYGSTAAAPLIANVGKLVDMVYGNDGSDAHANKLVEDVFEEYGISCVYAGNYSNNIAQLRISLLNDMPVILSARSLTAGYAHTFIADRYKRTRTVTRRHYEWVYENLTPPYTPVPAVPPYIEYSYSSPIISMIGFNWGEMNTYYNNNGWFSLTGDWIVGDEGGVPCNWNVSRNMIYGFSPIDNNSN